MSGSSEQSKFKQLIERGDVSKVKKFVQQTELGLSTFREGIFLALRHNHEKVATFLMEEEEKKGDKTSLSHTFVDATTGESTIHLISARGYLSALTILLKRPKVDINLRVKATEKTALYLACENGHDLVVLELVKNNAKRDLQCGGFTAFHAAAKRGATKCCEILLTPPEGLATVMTVSNPLKYAQTKSALLDQKTATHRTALHLAAVSGFDKVVELLLKYNADRTITEEHNKTALHLAGRNGHVQVIRHLLSGLQDRTKMSYLESTDMLGRTALHYAVEGSHLSAVEELVGAGANVNCKDNSGTRPLHLACMYGYLDIVHYLLRLSVTLLDCYTNENDSPLKLALLHKQYPSAKLLLQYRCDIKGNIPPLDLNKEESFADTREGLLDFLNSKTSKRGILQKKMKQRWVTLEIDHKVYDVNMLKWYDPSKTDKPKGQLNLSKYRVQHSETETFSLEPLEMKDRPYTFKASTKEDARDWINALQFYTFKKQSENILVRVKEVNRVASLSMMALAHESENQFSIVKTVDKRVQLGESVPDLQVPPGSIADLKILKSVEKDNNELQVVADYFAAKTVSTYPLHPETKQPQGLPICDRFVFGTSEKECYIALADGCGWGPDAREAAERAADAFVEFIKLHRTEITNTTQAVKFMLRAFQFSHHKIIEGRSQENVFMAGTTTMLAGVLLPLENDHAWIFVDVNLGDCKAYHYSVEAQSVRELTVGNRSNDPKDPGGRLGPYLNEGRPDLRNLNVHFAHCNENDLIFLLSDGVHDNLDPIQLGKQPADLQRKEQAWEDIPEQELLMLKTKWTENFLADILRKLGPELTPASITEKLIQHCVDVTANSRRWMENPANSKDKLPQNYVLYPGKMDHTTCVCIKVGRRESLANSTVIESKPTEDQNSDGGIKMVYDPEKGWILVEN